MALLVYQGRLLFDKNLEENLSKEISETQHEKINQQASEDLLKALS